MHFPGKEQLQVSKSNIKLSISILTSIGNSPPTSISNERRKECFINRYTFKLEWILEGPTSCSKQDQQWVIRPGLALRLKETSKGCTRQSDCHFFLTEKISPYMKSEPVVTIYAQCFRPSHHALLQKVWMHFLSDLLFKYWKTVIRSPQRFSAAKAQCWLMSGLPPTKTLQIFLVEWLSNRSGHCQYHCKGFLLSRPGLRSSFLLSFVQFLSAKES